MPYVKVYIHFVWSTKNRIPYLSTRNLRETMWKHILENGKEKDIFIDFVNGHVDHCHCLVSMAPQQSMSKVMQLIKGEAAHWFNKQELIEGKFEWQDEYYAASVSESNLNKVRMYIKNQEIHHLKDSSIKEFDGILIGNRFIKFVK